MLTLYMVNITTASLGFLYSSLASVVAMANIFTAMSNVVMMVTISLHIITIVSLFDYFSNGNISVQKKTSTGNGAGHFFMLTLCMVNMYIFS